MVQSESEEGYFSTLDYILMGGVAVAGAYYLLFRVSILLHFFILIKMQFKNK